MRQWAVPTTSFLFCILLLGLPAEASAQAFGNLLGGSEDKDKTPEPATTETTPAPQPTTNPDQTGGSGPLTLAEVREMVAGNVPAAAIVEMVKARKCTCKAGPSELVQLSQAGFPPELITAIAQNAGAKPVAKPSVEAEPLPESLPDKTNQAVDARVFSTKELNEMHKLYLRIKKENPEIPDFPEWLEQTGRGVTRVGGVLLGMSGVGAAVMAVGFAVGLEECQETPSGEEECTMSGGGVTALMGGIVGVVLLIGAAVNLATGAQRTQLANEARKEMAAHEGLEWQGVVVIRDADRKPAGLGIGLSF